MNQSDLGYQMILDGIQDMVVVMRVSENQQQFYYEFINKKAAEVLGDSIDIIDKEITEVNFPAVSAVMYEQYRTVIELRSPITYQDEFFYRRTPRKASETTLTPLFEGDKITRIVAVTRDITSIKKTENQKEMSNHRLELSRQRYKSLFAENTEPIAYLDLSSEILRTNKAFDQFINQPAKVTTGQTLATVLNPVHLTKFNQAFTKTVKGDVSVVDIKIFLNEQSEAVLQVKFIPMLLEGDVRGVYVILKDISYELFTKQALMASEERFRLIAENSSDLIELIDEKGRLVYLSPSHEKVLDYSTKRLAELHIYDIVVPEDHDKIEQLLTATYVKGQSITMELRFFNRENNPCWFELCAQPIFIEDNFFKHIVIVARNIEERKKYEERLKKLAYYDFLTNLPNRRLFNDRLNQVIATSKRRDTRFAVMMLDLDDFKKINDQMGHDVGDKVLIEFGERIKFSIREVDTVARLGGDEFIILISHFDDETNINRIVDRIEKAIAKPWRICDHTFSIKSSIGVAIPTFKGFTAQQILNKADECLYHAKNTGKNKAVIDFFDAE